MVNRGAQGRGFLKVMLAKSSIRCSSGDSSAVSQEGGEEEVVRCKVTTQGPLWEKGRHCFPERISGHLDHEGIPMVSKAKYVHIKAAQDKPSGCGKKILFVPLIN